MTHRTFLRGLTGIAACAALPGALFAQKKQQPNKPNVLIIYTDDMGVGDVSFLNSGWVQTPNIDRFASQGLIIDQYYSAAPVSSASRTGLTTGQFPLQWGINTYLSDRNMNRNCEQFDYLDASAPSMARVFKENGYATGHFGKWHMGGGRDVDDAPPITAYGFDEYVSTWESPDPDPLITGGNWIWQSSDSIKRWNRTAYFVDKTLDFLQRHKDQPCFVNLWPDDMHDPWVQGPEVEKKGKTHTSQPNFVAVLKEYDKQIGYLMKKLKEMGLEENTIVIFTSDNGPRPSFDQLRTNMLRGTKNSLYEGGIRMPFAIRWPKKIAPGQVDETTIVTALDLFPSLCKMAGISLPKDYVPCGEDMSKALMGHPQKRHKDMMWDFGRNNAFWLPTGRDHSPHLAVRRGDWKLLMDSDGGRVELYNLAEDPQENINVAADNQEIVDDLSQVLLAWWDTRKVRK